MVWVQLDPTVGWVEFTLWVLGLSLGSVRPNSGLVASVRSGLAMIFGLESCLAMGKEMG